MSRAHGLEALAEVHAAPGATASLESAGARPYDFALPGLVVHALLSGSPERLAAHLDRSSERAVTVLDCHDGIPMQPDLVGLLSPDEMRAIVGAAVRRGANVSRVLSPDGLVDPSFDVHQLNATLLDALDGDEESLVVARAIQLFAPGTPQVYYVGLLAGSNDQGAVRATGDGRAIGRHDYTTAEIADALGRPAVRRILRLLALRDAQPAFDGRFAVSMPAAGQLRLAWRARTASCLLDVDLPGRMARVEEVGAEGRRAFEA
jgi:sucrose phosphorylase